MLFLFLFLFTINICIKLFPAESPLIGMTKRSHFCPPGFYAHWNRSGLQTHQSGICTFCPFVSCFIVRSEDLHDGEEEEEDNFVNVMSCARKDRLPPAEKVAIYLDCVLTGDDENHLNLFIYHPRPYKKKYIAGCIHRNFLDWAVEDEYKFEIIELGFPMKNLPVTSLFIRYKEALSNLQYLVLTPLSDITKTSLARPIGLFTKTKIILVKELNGSFFPSVNQLSQCYIRPSHILFLNSCFVDTNSPNYPVVSKAKHEEENDRCVYKEAKTINNLVHEQSSSPIDQSPLDFDYLAAIVLTLILSIVIGIFILVYYIRNHSRFSAKKRQQRLEKKRAIDAYFKQSYLYKQDSTILAT